MVDLPRATPSSREVDASGIAHFLDGLEAADIELHSFMLLRHGDVIAEATWTPYQPGQLNLLYSLSKSFVSVAAGLAIAEERFGLDDRIVDLFPEFATNASPHWQHVTVRHCLSMATGHLDDPVFPKGDTDWLSFFLTVPPEREPGTVFTYNQLATHAVARIVHKTTRQRLIDYLRPRLFEPIGITDAAWLTDGRGHDAGFSGLHLSTDAIARFGQLLLQQGNWEGRQLVPAGWIAEATSLQMANDGAHRKAGTAPEPGSDWGRGYGYQFWMCRCGYRGDGAYGQFVLVLPEHDAVLVTTASTEQMQSVLDLVWSTLLPAFDQPGDEHSDAALRDRLCDAAIDGPADDRSGTTTMDLAREGHGCAPTVTSVRVGRDADDYVLTFRAGDDAMWHMPVGSGCWKPGLWMDDPGVPFASLGGWRDGTFVAHLRMIQTPHLLVLRADPTSSSVTLDWRDWPLHGAAPEWSSLRYS